MAEGSKAKLAKLGRTPGEREHTGSSTSAVSRSVKEVNKREQETWEGVSYFALDRGQERILWGRSGDVAVEEVGSLIEEKRGSVGKVATKKKKKRWGRAANILETRESQRDYTVG